MRHAVARTARFFLIEGGDDYRRVFTRVMGYLARNRLKRAEEAMRKLIEEKYPGHGIYGEEYGAVRTEAEYVW